MYTYMVVDVCLPALLLLSSSCCMSCEWYYHRHAQLKRQYIGVQAAQSCASHLPLPTLYLECRLLRHCLRRLSSASKI